MNYNTSAFLILLGLFQVSAKLTSTASTWQLPMKTSTVSGLASVVGKHLGRGIRVGIKGTTIATYTDSKGHYVLKQVPMNAVLVYSNAEAQTKEISVNGSKKIVIVLPRKDNKV